MSANPITNLFNAYDLQTNPYEADKINCQEVVDYCETRFRVALQAMLNSTKEDNVWMTKALFRELECCFSYIGVAAAIGRSVDIPIIVRTLGNDLYRFGFMPNAGFVPGLDLLIFLDGDLSSYGPDHPSSLVEEFHVAWWRSSSPPIKYSSYLSFATLKSALAKHRRHLANVSQPRTAPEPAGLCAELNKPSYTWHSETQSNLDSDCTRCRLYRAVPLGISDKLRDLYNWAHACEIANQAEELTAMRRASCFNMLYEAAMQKETDSGSGLDGRPNIAGSGWAGGLGSQKKMWKGKKKASEVAGDVRAHAQQLLQDSFGRPETRWTWGVNLTSQDLQAMVRGADRRYQLPHSGYDDSLESGKVKGYHSPDPDPNDFDSDVIFDNLASDFPDIRELHPDEVPLAFGFPPLHYSAACESDSNLGIIPEFGGRNAITHGKQRMQAEANKPDSPSTSDDISMISKRSPPRRPWLIPPPQAYVPPPTSSGPGSEPGHAQVAAYQLQPGITHSSDQLYRTIRPSIEDVIFEGGPFFPIYVPSEESSPHQDHMILSEVESDSHNAMVVVSDDGVLDIPIGDLGLSDDEGSDPAGLSPSNSPLLAPLTVVMPDDLDLNEEVSQIYIPQMGSIAEEDIVPSTVYMSDSDPDETGPNPDHVPVLPHVLFLPRMDPVTGRYTAASFTDIPDDWLE